MYMQWRIQDFPWGGVDLVGGAVDPRGSYISKILHVKTKESGPAGGARAGRGPPWSANDMYIYIGNIGNTVFPLIPAPLLFGMLKFMLNITSELIFIFFIYNICVFQDID